MNLTLKVWRQSGPQDKGKMETVPARGISPEWSFLEMLDDVNEKLILEGKTPIHFDSDCREGICGMCGCVVNGHAHGGHTGTTLCQLHMRHFKDGDVIAIEPWRSRAFPVIKDLVVDREAFEKIMHAGGYVSVITGGAPDANSIPIPINRAEEAMDAAACIGCGACVASCPNGSAMLFVSAKVSQFALLPQGQVESGRRAKAMVMRMDAMGFGNCGNHRECEVHCPKSISIRHIARLNLEYLKAAICRE
jgi:succinate dehydrogenase / fumarate reductase, iron-sulfur subunit